MQLVVRFWWDFVMTLDQEWFSTLFGVFFLIGNLQATMGILIAIAVTVRNHSTVLAEYITINRLHDLTKLALAFSFPDIHGLFTIHCDLVCRSSGGNTILGHLIPNRALVNSIFDSVPVALVSVSWG